MQFLIAVTFCAVVLVANARLLPVLDVSTAWGGWGSDNGDGQENGRGDGNDGSGDDNGLGNGNVGAWGLGNLIVGAPHGAPHIVLLTTHTLGAGHGAGQIGGIDAGAHGHGHEGYVFIIFYVAF